MEQVAGQVRLTILGEPASKANSRKLVTNRKTKRPMFIKSEKARAFLRGLERQVPTLDPLLLGQVKVTITIYYASERPDLDESLILDGLQGRIYKNDRQVREKHVFHAIDRLNPRTEILIEPRQSELFSERAA